MLASIGPRPPDARVNRAQFHAGPGSAGALDSLDARAATQPGRRLPTLMGLSSAVVRTGKGRLQASREVSAVVDAFGQRIPLGTPARAQMVRVKPHTR